MGTLVELDDPVAALVAALRAHHGLDVAPEEARRALAAEIAYYRAHHDDGRDAASLRDLRRRCALALREALPAPARTLTAAALVPSLLAALRFRAFDDAAPALAALHDGGLRLAVVSNWDVSLHGVLADLGLDVHLDAILTSAEVGARKPAATIFTAALARLGVRAAETVHVGDSLEHDVAGAAASGLRALLLRRAGRRAPPAIASLAELPDLLLAVQP